MEKEYLVIQGRVAKNIRKPIWEDNCFFVSHSPLTIPIGWLFHDEKGNILELVKVYMQEDLFFQYEKAIQEDLYLKEIPKGWSSICQFNGDIDIDEINGWEYKEEIIKKIYPFTKAEMREKQIKSIIE